MTKKEIKRIETACSLLIFADRESLGDERFKQTVDTAINFDKSVLCVHIEPFEYETSWAKMQLGPQQAIISKGSDADASITEQLKSAEIFKDLRVTKTQKQRKRRQMTSLIATPVALALIVLGVLFATGVLPPNKNVEPIISAADVEPVIELPFEGLSGTAAELAEVKMLTIVCKKYIESEYFVVGEPSGWHYATEAYDWMTKGYDKIQWGVIDSDKTVSTRGNMTDLSFLQYFPNLEMLCVVGERITDISPIFELKNLQALSLSCNDVGSIEGIEALQELMLVDLAFNKLTDVSPLFKCPNLVLVNLNGNGLTEIGTDDLSKIVYLDINNTHISELPKVGVGEDYVLVRASNTNLTDYSFLSECNSFDGIQADGSVKDTLLPAIEGKEIYGYMQWEHCDIESLKELDGIVFAPDGWGLLEIVRSDLSDVKGAEKIKGLKFLSLFTNPKLKSLKGLEKAEGLIHIGINNGLIDEAEALKEKTGVTYNARYYGDQVSFWCNEGANDYININLSDGLSYNYE